MDNEDVRLACWMAAEPGIILIFTGSRVPG